MTENSHEEHLRQTNPDYYAYLERLAAGNREKNEQAADIGAMREYLRANGILS
ncbi:hypothetical protein MYP14_04715 [Rhodococcus pyridinivorans]|uniref:hypothetical protein n=1 Tax=Rhodococcus pyridinivorans TaxID=103816 RepID=UPI001FFF9EF7|nr:hypothetical protein [Rhodococcus pyridinivorans]UPK64669.1 hypothetical protein MYP14_04715 [Rhodococcus pyridinivorans]